MGLHPGLPGDTDCFGHGVQQAVGLVAHMGGVDAVVFGNDLTKLNDLFRLAVAAGGVYQSGGEAGSALLHGLIQKLLHLLQLHGSGLPVVHAHNGATQGLVTDKGQLVAAGTLRGLSGEQLFIGAAERGVLADTRKFGINGINGIGQRGQGMAAVAADLGGDTLTQLAQPGGVGEQLGIGVGV